MKVAVYSYDSTLLDVEKAESVSLPGFSGQFCVYPKHISLVTLLKEGTISVSYKEGKTSRVKEVKIKDGTFSIKNDEAIAVVTL